MNRNGLAFVGGIIRIYISGRYDTRRFFAVGTYLYYISSSTGE